MTVSFHLISLHISCDAFYLSLLNIPATEVTFILKFTSFLWSFVVFDNYAIEFDLKSHWEVAFKGKTW